MQFQQSSQPGDHSLANTASFQRDYGRVSMHGLLRNFWAKGESSYIERLVRSLMVWWHNPARVAPGGVPKAEATELAPGAVGGSPLRRQRRVEGFSLETGGLLLVKLRSGGFGRKPRGETAGVSPSLGCGGHLRACQSGGLGRSKKPCIQVLWPPALWSLRTVFRLADGVAGGRPSQACSER